jgi:hypothetical protein
VRGAQALEADPNNPEVLNAYASLLVNVRRQYDKACGASVSPWLRCGR